ncbi:MAG: hypothetical protein JNM21_10670 [Taibaiella sp.]|nr:hypothetical protein [Taibaiella sp.]
MNKNITGTFLLFLSFIFLGACGKRSNTIAREGVYAGHLYKHKSVYLHEHDLLPTHTYDTFDLIFQLFLSADSIFLKSYDESLLESMQFSKKEFNKNGIIKSGSFRYNVTITKDSIYYHVNSYSPTGSGTGSSTTFKGYRR